MMCSNRSFIDNEDFWLKPKKQWQSYSMLKLIQLTII